MAVAMVGRFTLRVVMVRAAIVHTAMLRMDLFACHFLIKGHDKALAAATAGMYAETDDTHEVPSDQQSCKHLCNQAFHSNMQS